ncbi:MAG: TIGR03617 family F420-dependent LLM class oxidoreductase [Pseudomonadales bacterium]|nr:TIGR03617 family F420-dependent LLM class oxidoreductase [Pseudomonadales bacterium]
MSHSPRAEIAVDGAMLVENPADAGPLARQLEDAGYDGAYTFEGRHDPFLPLAIAAGATEHLQLQTGIAVAFARNPMLLANLGYDLQLLSRGRFMLGLGSQIRPHIEKRYSATWSHPAARMREMVLAIRAIWDCWEQGTPLDFRGEYYTHTLMTPVFNPGPNPHGLAPIYVAAVGPHMTEVAGEVGDGILVHPFNTPRFVADQLLPALERGRRKSTHSRDSFSVSCQFIVASGLDAKEQADNLALARGQVAFYASTPAYRPVLDSHGCAELQPRLNALSKQGKWQEMSSLLSDELVAEIVISGTPEEVGERIRERCAGWCQRVSPVVYTGSAELRERLVRAIKQT